MGGTFRLSDYPTFLHCLPFIMRFGYAILTDIGLVFALRQQKRLYV